MVTQCIEKEYHQEFIFINRTHLNESGVEFDDLVNGATEGKSGSKSFFYKFDLLHRPWFLWIVQSFFVDVMGIVVFPDAVMS